MKTELPTYAAHAAYDAGAEAYGAGRPLQKCPICPRKALALHRCWVDGWMAACAAGAGATNPWH